MWIPTITNAFGHCPFCACTILENRCKVYAWQSYETSNLIASVIYNIYGSGSSDKQYAQGKTLLGTTFSVTSDCIICIICRCVYYITYKLIPLMKSNIMCFNRCTFIIVSADAHVVLVPICIYPGSYSINLVVTESLSNGSH